ncbi:methionine--tRNA ligase [Vibrio viridaestus]|uniref:Methionine--tRNA ligase n=2 Tax=Vibrio viridaestus TaxID=2487322 RepID=A0A3N9TL27_9VIBR|nr:methionine--tRNA ligase [Vibrio viridaestus]
MSSKQRFITTPIFYANGQPHLGHAYTGIIADIFHRFSTLSGEQSRLITGTDEHGQKIATTAQASQLPTQTFIDQISETFRALWPQLNIVPDIFVRTTENDHQQYIQTIWRKLQQQGDIYVGSYCGEYCVACEQYYPQRELIDQNICPVHKQPVSHIEEETYLFRLEKYRLRLLEYYQTNPNVIVPSHFQDNIIEQLKSGELDDLSISRVHNQWGIPVPDNASHTVYVWIDALFSYISAILKAEATQENIANTQHIIGKDILIFHAVYWPAFLMALDLPLPEKLLVHGWWTINGDKISKSNPATTVNPASFAERLTQDGLRYALVRQKPLFRDGNVDLDEFAELLNADLLNNYANLVKRTNTLIVRYFAGHISPDSIGELDDESIDVIDLLSANLKLIIHSYTAGNLFQVVKEIHNALSQLNSFFHTRSPWLVNKGQPEQKAQQTCFIVSTYLREITWLLSPITPTLCHNVLEEMGLPQSSILNQKTNIFAEIEALSANSHWVRI